jgi:uncharacterized protein YbjT (DUF2867 family)
MWAAAVRAGLPVPNMTGSGRQGVVHPGDVAGIAVEALVSGEHDGRLHTLTGPEAISVVTDDVPRVLGRPARNFRCWVEDRLRLPRRVMSNER